MLGCATDVRCLVVIALATTACGRFGFGTHTDSDAAGGIAPVQQVTAASEQASQMTSLSATLPALPRAGSLLVMIGALQSQALTSVTGAGTSWRLAIYSDMYANVEVWYGITDGTDATVQIGGTVPSDLWISLAEWRGVTDVLDAKTAMDGLISPATAGTITCGDAGDLVLFAAADNLPNTFGEPTGGTWSPLEPAGSSQHAEQPWYTACAPLETLSPTVAETSGNWGVALVAFRLAP